MSYIGLLNESITTTYTNVSASDDMTIGSSLRNLGTLTQVGAATFSGSLTGLMTAVSNGLDLTYTYDPTLRTFTIQINNGSITNSKLAGNISLSNLASGGAYQMILTNGSGVPTYGSMTLNNLPTGLVNQFIQTNGSSNAWTTMSGDATLSSGVLTIGTGAITNSKLAGNISLSNLVSGGAFQMILCNGSGVPTYASLSLNNLPSGLVNQFIQTNGSSNNWTTMSGDATLSSGVLTIGAGKITNTKLLNSSISLNGHVMSLGSTAYTLTTKIYHQELIIF